MHDQVLDTWLCTPAYYTGTIIILGPVPQKMVKFNSEGLMPNFKHSFLIYKNMQLEVTKCY